jgi:hypothetical protein
MDLTLGFPIPDQYFRNYYWLVPGIGKAVHAISAGSTTVPPESLTTAKTLLRVFESSNVEPPSEPRPVSGLRIRLQTGSIVLDWDAAADAGAYSVRRFQELGGNEWELAGEPATNSWSEILTSSRAQRFYSVWTKP